MIVALGPLFAFASAAVSNYNMSITYYSCTLLRFYNVSATSVDIDLASARSRLGQERHLCKAVAILSKNIFDCTSTMIAQEMDRPVQCDITFLLSFSTQPPQSKTPQYRCFLTILEGQKIYSQALPCCLGIFMIPPLSLSENL